MFGNQLHWNNKIPIDNWSKVDVIVLAASMFVNLKLQSLHKIIFLKIIKHVVVKVNLHWKVFLSLGLVLAGKWILLWRDPLSMLQHCINFVQKALKIIPMTFHFVSDAVETKMDSQKNFNYRRIEKWRIPIIIGIYWWTHFIDILVCNEHHEQYQEEGERFL